MNYIQEAEMRGFILGYTQARGLQKTAAADPASDKILKAQETLATVVQEYEAKRAEMLGRDNEKTRAVRQAMYNRDRFEEEEIAGGKKSKANRAEGLRRLENLAIGLGAGTATGLGVGALTKSAPTGVLSGMGAGVLSTFLAARLRKSAGLDEEVERAKQITANDTYPYPTNQVTDDKLRFVENKKRNQIQDIYDEAEKRALNSGDKFRDEVVSNRINHELQQDIDIVKNFDLKSDEIRKKTAFGLNKFKPLDFGIGAGVGGVTGLATGKFTNSALAGILSGVGTGLGATVLSQLYRNAKERNLSIRELPSNIYRDTTAWQDTEKAEKPFRK